MFPAYDVYHMKHARLEPAIYLVTTCRFLSEINVFREKACRILRSDKCFEDPGRVGKDRQVMFRDRGDLGWRVVLSGH